MVHMLDDKDKLNPAYKALKQEIEYFKNKYKLIGKECPYRFSIEKYVYEQRDRELEIVCPRPLMTDINGQRFTYLIKIQNYIIQNEIHDTKDGILRIRIPEFADSVDFLKWLTYQVVLDDSMMQYILINAALRDVDNNIREIHIIGNNKAILCNFGDIYRIKLEEVVCNQSGNTVNIVQSSEDFMFRGFIKFENFDGLNIRLLRAQNWGSRIISENTDDLKGLKLRRLDNFQKFYAIALVRPYIDTRSIDFSNVRSLCCAFKGCDARTLDLSNFKFNQILDLSGAFQDCENLERILNFDSSQLSEQFSKLKYAFRSADYTDSMPYVQFEGAFSNCLNLSESDILRITDGITVDNMRSAFHGCKKLLRIPNVDFTHCKKFNTLFYKSGLSGKLVLDGLKYSGLKNPIYITHKLDIPNTDVEPWKYLNDSSKNLNVLRHYNVYLRNKRHNYTVFPLNSNNLDIFEKPVFYTDGENIDEQLRLGDKLLRKFKDTPSRLRLVGENFGSMFTNCDELTEIEIKNIQICLTLEDAQYNCVQFGCVEMFLECKHLKRVVIQNIKIQCNLVEDKEANCVAMFGYMFLNCENLEEVLIENVDLSDATEGINFEGMFMNCKKLRKLTIRNVIFGIKAFGFSTGDSVLNMFLGCDSLVNGDVQLQDIDIIAYGELDSRSLNKIIKKRNKLISYTPKTDNMEVYLRNHKKTLLLELKDLAFRDTSIQCDKYNTKELNNLRKLFKLCRYLNSNALEDI